MLELFINGIAMGLGIGIGAGLICFVYLWWVNK
jgi:hypothetical protein